MKKTGLFLVLILISCHVTFAQTKYKSVDSLFRFDNQFNGDILISENGQITFKNSYGFANFETKQILNDKSAFQIASLTKQFTAIAIVILKEKGKLKFDDKITMYLPELKEFSNISIRNLLNHTSGISDYGQPNDKTIIDTILEKYTTVNNNDLISMLAKNNVKPKRKPNVEYEYSNTNYALLGSIIQRVSHDSYEAFLKRNIFIPLDMTNSFVYSQNMKNHKNLALGYMLDSLNKPILPQSLEGYEPFKKVVGILGDQGIYSTTVDLYRWLSKFTSLVSKQSLVEIFKPVILNDNTKSSYGFGFELGYWKDYSKIYFHGGRLPGYNSYVEVHPANKKIFIVLENKEDDNFNSRIQEMKNLIYGIAPNAYINLTQNDIKKFSGKYRTKNGSIKEIMLADGKLYVPMNPVVKLELKPISKTRFIVQGFKPEVEYEFIIKDGKVEKYINKQPEEGIKNEATKIE